MRQMQRKHRKYRHQICRILQVCLIVRFERDYTHSILGHASFH